MDGEMKVTTVPLTSNKTIVKWFPRSRLLQSANPLNTLSSMLGTDKNTRALIGRIDQENIFRECVEESFPEMLSCLGEDGSLYAVEVPIRESPLHFDILVNVGVPQVKQAVTWGPDTLRTPRVLRLLRLANYDSMYESVRSALQEACPFLPDYDTTDQEGLPWWVWTEEQDREEHEAREVWAVRGRRYPEVKKGKNPNCNWVQGNKHYFFRLYKVDHPDEHLLNDGLPSPAWGQGLHHLCLEYHPLYARKVFKGYN